MDLEKYIAVKHKNSPTWFIQELNTYENQERITDTYEIKNYLDGQHNILNRPNFKYNGQVIEPRKIVIQMAKTILNFKTQYLLKNPVQFIGNETMINEFLKVNKLGRFDDKNEKILNRILKFGQVAEYLFINSKGRIDSKIINADEGTPVFNQYGDMMAFIEHYTFDGITYYVVYTDESVQEWNNEGGELHNVGSYPNISGLPILYMSEDEFSNTRGRSELKDYINILDNMEDTLSKYVDSMYKFMNPIPVVSGQQLKDSLPQDIVGAGINLDDGATFTFESGELDSDSFELVYKTLQQTLLDVSSTPAVSMNKTDISNLSEVSIKLLFSLADTSAGVYENYLINGFIDRWERVARLLAFKSVRVNEDDLATLDFKFAYNIPSNHKEVLDNMKTQYDMGAISTETILENSPYISDVSRELERLKDIDKVVNDVAVNE
ncbi:MAG TPA: phage portal protein [Niallia sp.]|nr:phage portal protein [Niallia sp.]